MAFDHQPPNDPSFTIAHTIGQCPYFKVGEKKLIGQITKLVYTRLIGGTCQAFEQVALLVLKRHDEYQCIHPGWMRNCNDCHLTHFDRGLVPRRIDHIGDGERFPIATEVITSTTHPITEGMFMLMIASNHIVDISDRYDLIEL